MILDLAARERLTNFFSVVFTGEAVRLTEGGESDPLANECWSRVGFFTCACF